MSKVNLQGLRKKVEALEHLPEAIEHEVRVHGVSVEEAKRRAIARMESTGDPRVQVEAKPD